VIAIWCALENGAEFLFGPDIPRNCAQGKLSETLEPAGQR